MLLGLVLVVVTIGTAGVLRLVDPPGPAPARASGDVSAPARSERGIPEALAVLRGWDVRRADAWAAGDVPGLRRLYTAGSSAGRHDVAMLRSWLGRGLRVSSMDRQLLSARVPHSSADRLVLVVTDRLASAEVAGAGVAGALPRDAAGTVRMVLLRVSGEWRMESVESQARPVARTSRTSRSRNS